jgi:hypothetical protein
LRHYNLFTQLGNPGVFNEKGFAIVDQIISWCKADNIYVVLDLHAAPGGENSGDISDYVAGQSSLWEDVAGSTYTSAQNRAVTIALWKELARRYANEGTIGGYDLINETNWTLPNNTLLLNLMKDITAAIRTVDNNHILFVEGNSYANDYSGLTPAWDNNMAYSFHKYWNDVTDASLNFIFQIRDSQNVPIWMGEFGENSNHWIRNAVELMNKNNIGWAIWPFKKMGSISGAVSFKEPANWSAMATYINGGVKPSAAVGQAILDEMVQNVKLSNCSINSGYLYALFANNPTATKPFSSITLPARIPATQYDEGKNGMAYSDVVYQTTQFGAGGGDYTAWNTGWYFRNDGVDIQYSTAEKTAVVGWAVDNEWMNYTINTIGTKNYDLKVRVAGMGGKLTVMVDGIAVIDHAPIASTGDWDTWSTVDLGTVNIASGSHVVKVVISTGGYNLNYLDFSEICTATITSPTTNFCVGGNVLLTASTGSSYKWMNGTTQVGTAQTYTATAAGSYTVEVTNTSGCKAVSAATVIAVNALPTATITSPTTSFCIGGNVVLTASAGSSYKWMNGTTQVGTAQTYTATAAGSYTVEVTNISACKAVSAATVITMNALPTATITSPTTSFCIGGNVVLTASAGSSYKWMNGTTQVGTAQTYTATAAGSYTLELTNTSGCKAVSAAIVITVSALPSATITSPTTSFCIGGNVVLTASAGSSYKWMNGTTQVGTAQTYTATAAGSYTVEVTNTSACKAVSAATVITMNALPTAPIVSVPQIAYCQNVLADQLLATGTSMKWYTTAIGGIGSTIAPTPGTSSIGVTNYYVSQTTTGCEGSRAQVTVTINELPMAIITTSGSTNIPQGGSVDLIANVGSGLSYKWFKGSLQIATDASYTATSVGIYTVEVTNSSNCTATSAGTNVNLNSNQPSLITITSPSANSTIHGAITIAASVTDPDGTISLVEYLDGNTVIGTSTSAPYNFVWNNPGGGNHVITVRVTDSNGGITTSAPVEITSEAIATGLYSANSNTLNGVVYPNPASGIVFIDSDTDLSDASFMLVDVIGNEQELSQTPNGSGVQIDVSNLSAGAYVLIIKKNGSILRKKVTVIK